MPPWDPNSKRLIKQHLTWTEQSCSKRSTIFPLLLGHKFRYRCFVCGWASGSGSHFRSRPLVWEMLLLKALEHLNHPFEQPFFSHYHWPEYFTCFNNYKKIFLAGEHSCPELLVGFGSNIHYYFWGATFFISREETRLVFTVYTLFNTSCRCSVLLCERSPAAISWHCCMDACLLKTVQIVYIVPYRMHIFENALINCSLPLAFPHSLLFLSSWHHALVTNRLTHNEN